VRQQLVDNVLTPWPGSPHTDGSSKSSKFGALVLGGCGWETLGRITTAHAFFCRAAEAEMAD